LPGYGCVLFIVPVYLAHLIANEKTVVENKYCSPSDLFGNGWPVT
jgi:hypothetical protein